MTDVADRPDRRRFESVEAGHTVYADYALEGEAVLAILHVETPPALRGRGAAGRLMAGICEIAEGRGLRLRPVCSYAARYLERRREGEDPPISAPISPSPLD